MMLIKLKAEVHLTVETAGIDSAKARHVDFNLDVSKNLMREYYLDKEGLPTKNGSKVLSQILVQGLIANIHQAHQNGYLDSAKHLRSIISELEDGFVQVVEVQKAYFDETK